MSDLPKVYDPNTARSYHDHWVGRDTEWKCPDLEAGKGYTDHKVHEAYIGSPESQGYENVHECTHPSAVAWVENMKRAKIARLERQLAKLKGE